MTKTTTKDDEPFAALTQKLVIKEALGWLTVP